MTSTPNVDPQARSSRLKVWRCGLASRTWAGAQRPLRRSCSGPFDALNAQSDSAKAGFDRRRAALKQFTLLLGERPWALGRCCPCLSLALKQP